MMISPAGKALQRGFTMVEMLAALAIAAIMMVGLTMMINTTLEDTRAQQAALYQSQLAGAAAQLIQQNYAALSAKATPTQPVVVPLNSSGPYQLVTYLSSHMQAQNAYNQTPCLLVYPGAAGGVDGLLVTEGGRTIADAELGYIAANAGLGGGSIQSINNPSGSARGAFGSWVLAAPNPANASCSGTKTATGHVVSEVFYNGTQSQNADFLYRVGVPGNANANTMQVPIILAQQTDYQPCTTVGAVAADAAGNMVVCQGGMWEPQASFHWRSPVQAFANLNGLSTKKAGDVAVSLATQRAYAYDGSNWQPLAVDEAGNLSVPGWINLGNTQVMGSPCTPSSTATQVATDAGGRVLSCQPYAGNTNNYEWLNQSEITPGSQYSGCTILMMSPGANDYPQCAGPPSFNYYGPPYGYNNANGTFSYTYTVPVTLVKPGVIVASSWAHMNDSICTSGNNPPPRAAQLAQNISILDSNKNSLAYQEAQGPTMNNDSGGINNALTQSAPAGNYTVSITTSWATYNGISTPWTSSFCGAHSQTIINSPVVEGSSVNTYY